MSWQCVNCIGALIRTATVRMLTQQFCVCVCVCVCFLGFFLPDDTNREIGRLSYLEFPVAMDLRILVSVFTLQKFIPRAKDSEV